MDTTKPLERQCSDSWDLSGSISDLNEIVGSISYSDRAEAPGEVDYAYRQLSEAAGRLSLGFRNFQSTIEEHARFSDMEWPQQRSDFVSEVHTCGHGIHSGMVQRQAVLMDLELYGEPDQARDQEPEMDQGEMMPEDAAGFANDMKEYADRLETGMNEKIHELAEIGASVASLSHCVKNIVNNLKAGSFIMEKGIKKENTDMMKQGWTMLGKNINRMSDLALDMLTYSKKRKPDYEDCELNAILDEVVDCSQEKASSHGVRLMKEFDPDVGLIHLEQKGIYRSILNLVGNSIDACDGVDDPTVTVRSKLLLDQGMVRIDVTDTGIGMTEETKDKLFTSFFSTKGSKGTGLGLPTTFKIIKEHSGTINVESEYGRGTTFTITLPIEPPEQPALEQPDPIPPSPAA